MKTNQLVRTILFVVLFCVCIPFASLATDTPTMPAHRQEQLQKLEQRLEEIRAMDTKGLSRDEKRALRGEVKTIKKEMKAMSGGVYISIGALILIALLLILLA
jgi:hypothetical protein